MIGIAIYRLISNQQSDWSLCNDCTKGMGHVNFQPLIRGGSVSCEAAGRCGSHNFQPPLFQLLPLSSAY